MAVAGLTPAGGRMGWAAGAGFPVAWALLDWEIGVGSWTAGLMAIWSRQT